MSETACFPDLQKSFIDFQKRNTPYLFDRSTRLTAGRLRAGGVYYLNSTPSRCKIHFAEAARAAAAAKT